MKKIFSLIDLKYIIIYLLIINFIGVVTMLIDKYKAQKGFWRTPEKTIFIITLLGGGIGTISGMYLFRHKTKKLKFTIGLPTILISEIFIVVYFLLFYWWYKMIDLITFSAPYQRSRFLCVNEIINN